MKILQQPTQMKYAIVAASMLTALAFAIPSQAMACDNYDDQAYITTTVTGHGDLPNHQSSLSSTTEGGTTTTTSCPDGDPSDNNGG